MIIALNIQVVVFWLDINMYEKHAVSIFMVGPKMKTAHFTEMLGSNYKITRYTLKMEAACYSRTLIRIYRNTGRTLKMKATSFPKTLVSTYKSIWWIAKMEAT